MFGLRQGFVVVIVVWGASFFGTPAEAAGPGLRREANREANRQEKVEKRGGKQLERRIESVADQSSQFVNPRTLLRSAFEKSDKFVPVSRIDELFLNGLKKKGLEPAALCSDAVFVRRVYLDVIGTLPTATETKKFLDDSAPDKRSVLIDDLLNRSKFADYWAMRWADVLRVKAEFPINLWPNGAMVYYRWIHAAIRENKPFDRFARELLTADGSNFRDAPSNFYRAVSEKDAETIAEAVAQTFLGTRIGPWPEEKRKEIATFFSRVGFKGSAEWKEEIVFWDRTPLDSSNVVFPDGTKGKIQPNQDPRAVFADWLVSPNNVGFRENAANRVWYWLFGRGLVQEPDDFRSDNPPVYPELLQFLGKELADKNFDLKTLYRLILNSRTYQQSSIPKEPKDNAEECFAVYPVRRLEAEVLQDALNQIFNVRIGYASEVPEPFTLVPPRYRTILLPDPSISSSFLEMFGRATRDSGLESDRNNDVTESQELFLLNSTEINEWSRKFLQRFQDVDRTQQERRTVLDGIWLTILSRYPTSVELQRFVGDFRKSDQSPRDNIQDLVWALINTKEFFCRH